MEDIIVQAAPRPNNARLDNIDEDFLAAFDSAEREALLEGLRIFTRPQRVRPISNCKLSNGNIILQGDDNDDTYCSTQCMGVFGDIFQ